MQYPKGIDGVAILNGFVDYAIALQREQVGADLKVIVNNRLNELKGKIDAARSNYETSKAAKIARLLEADKVKRARLRDELTALRLQLKMERNGQLAELDEAISIARSVGIKNPTVPAAMGEDAYRGSSQVMRTVVTNQKLPLYFMGTALLEAERKALQQRTNDDFTNTRVAEIGKELRMLDVNREVEVLNSRQNEDVFLQGVEPLWAEEARLRGLNIDMSALKLVTVDRQAQAPLNPIKPKGALIIALSGRRADAGAVARVDSSFRPIAPRERTFLGLTIAVYPADNVGSMPWGLLQGGPTQASFRHIRSTAFRNSWLTF
jgi:LPS O-antigen subunit length determinant protein (WzzB/FepE family)